MFSKVHSPFLPFPRFSAQCCNAHLTVFLFQFPLFIYLPLYLLYINIVQYGVNAIYSETWHMKVCWVTGGTLQAGPYISSPNVKSCDIGEMHLWALSAECYCLRAAEEIIITSLPRCSAVHYIRVPIKAELTSHLFLNGRSHRPARSLLSEAPSWDVGACAYLKPERRRKRVIGSGVYRNLPCCFKPEALNCSIYTEAW